MHPEIVTRAQDEAVDLLHDVLRIYPPVTGPYMSDIPDHLLPLGSHLLRLGYATPRQIDLALRLQRQRAQQGVLWPLGDILVAQEVINPRVLTAVLLVQLVERVAGRDGAAPRFLGEHLVAMELLSPVQLAPVIQQQTSLRLDGAWKRLGELLTQQGLINRATLEEVLSAQRTGEVWRK